LAEKIPAWFASAVTRYLAPEIIRIVDERVTRSEASLRELMNTRLKAVEDTMNTRLKAVEDTMNTRFKAVEDTMNTCFKSIDNHFSAIDDRFKAIDDAMNARFATLDAKIDGFEKRLDLVQRVALLEAKVREIDGKRSGSG